MVLLSFGALYGCYELGRYRAGFDVLDAVRESNALRAELQHVKDATAGLRAQAAVLQTVQASQEKERAEVSRTIGGLQAQVARQSQELTFYKGLVVKVAKGANTPEVKIQQLRIAAGAQPRAYVVTLTLMQVETPKNQVSGTVLLSVAGQTQGRVDTLDLGRLTAGRIQEQSFTLRYFENMQFDLTLPAGFKPERLQAEVRSSRRGVTPLVQSFLWTLEAN
jgi:hypothetical protein